MPKLAVTDLVKLSYIMEDPENPGVVPAVPLTPIRYESESLQVKKTSVVSKTIRPDRQVSGSKKTGESADGGISFEFAAKEYDVPFLEAAFCNHFTDAINKAAATLAAAAVDNSINDSAAGLPIIPAGHAVHVAGFATAGNKGFGIVAASTAAKLTLVPGGGDFVTLVDEAEGAAVVISSGGTLTDGTLPIRKFVEREHTDVDTIFKFEPLQINELDINITSEAIITMQATHIGLNGDIVEESIGTGAPAAPEDTEPMDASTNVSDLIVNGALSGFSKDIKMKLANNLRPQTAIANAGLVGIGMGKCNLTFTDQCYFQSGANFLAMKADSNNSKHFITKDAEGNAYVWSIPRYKITGGAGGNVTAESTDIMETLNCQASVDPVTGHTILVTRFPVA